MSTKVFMMVLVVLILVMGIQIYNLNDKRLTLKRTLSNVNAEVDTLEKENKQLQADMEYFADPVNLAKELRSKFNYKKPGEKLIIVIPKE